MESVIRVRQSGRTRMGLPAELPEVDGYIAVEKCSQIGEIWYLRPEGGEGVESFLVVDCSGSIKTSEWMMRNNILVEVDWGTVLRWGGAYHRGIRLERLQLIQKGVRE